MVLWRQIATRVPTASDVTDNPMYTPCTVYVPYTVQYTSVHAHPQDWAAATQRSGITLIRKLQLQIKGALRRFASPTLNLKPT